MASVEWKPMKSILSISLILFCRSCFMCLFFIERCSSYFTECTNEWKPWIHIFWSKCTKFVTAHLCVLWTSVNQSTAEGTWNGVWFSGPSLSFSKTFLFLPTGSRHIFLLISSSTSVFGAEDAFKSSTLFLLRNTYEFLHIRQNFVHLEGRIEDFFNISMRIVTTELWFRFWWINSFIHV